MKALLVVGSPNPARSDLEWTGIVLLPTDNPKDDPLFVISFDDYNGIRFGSISSQDLEKLRVAKEVELSNEVIGRINYAYMARAEFDKREADLKEAFLKEKVDPSCDALSFLDYGSTLL